MKLNALGKAAIAAGVAYVGAVAWSRHQGHQIDDLKAEARQRRALEAAQAGDYVLFRRVLSEVNVTGSDVLDCYSMCRETLRANGCTPLPTDCSKST